MRLNKFYDEASEAGTTGDEPVEEAVSEEVVAEEVVEQPVEEELAVEAPPSFIDTVREKYNVDLSSKYQNDDAAIEGLINAQRKIGERDELADMGREYMQYQPQFQQFLSTLNQPEPQQEEEPWWNPPQLPENITQYIGVNPETNERAWVEGTPMEVKQAYEKHAEYLANFQRNPQPFFDKYGQQIEQKVTQKFEQMLQEREYKAEQDRIANTILQQNESWIYQHDQNGNRVKDINGQPQLTPQGMVWAQEIQRLGEQGLANSVEANRVAVMAVQQQFGGQQQPAPAPAKPATQKKAPQSNNSEINGMKGKPLKDRLMEMVTDEGAAALLGS